MLWSQIIYGHRTASISPKIVRFYGARPAAGGIVRFLINFLDIVRCPVNFRYYLKFHGARTAFGRVTEDKITSFTHIGRAPDDFCLRFISYNSNSVRAPYDVWQAPGTLRNLLTNRPTPVRAPDDARPGTGQCFMSRTATGEKRRVLQKYLHRYFTCKDQKHKYKYINFNWAAEDD